MARLVVSGVRDPLELAQVAIADRASSQQLPRTHAAFVQQVIQLVQVPTLIREVGEPVQGPLVAVVGP